MTSKLQDLLELNWDNDEPTPVDGLASWPPPELFRQAVQLGYRPKERCFDRLLPPELRVVSGQYWTPLEVAIQAARWFDDLRIASVLDIGSGVGKFCIASALAGSARYVGIEQRPQLVEAGHKLARTFKVDDRVCFLQGIFGQTPIPRADAYYLFNPFGENLFDSGDHIDEEVELSDERYLRDTGAVEALLIHAPVGTYVLTYNGFGGSIPNSYRQVRVNRELPNVLRMWRKVRNLHTGNLSVSES